jgi:hypothetical protein
LIFKVFFYCLFHLKYFHFFKTEKKKLAKWLNVLAQLVWLDQTSLGPKDWPGFGLGQTPIPTDLSSSHWHTHRLYLDPPLLPRDVVAGRFSGRSPAASGLLRRRRDGALPHLALVYQFPSSIWFLLLR